jgi:uncharacterized membrane protein YkvA (DUF1232 family)
MRHTHFLPHWTSILRFLRDRKSDWKPKALALIAIFYLIVPLDLIPDLAPLIGWIDDLGGVALATIYLLRASRAYETAIEQNADRDK